MFWWWVMLFMPMQHITHLWVTIQFDSVFYHHENITFKLLCRGMRSSDLLWYYMAVYSNNLILCTWSFSLTVHNICEFVDIQIFLLWVLSLTYRRNLFLTIKQVLHPIADSMNINNQVWEMYFRNLIPRLVKKGDDGNCGSTAVCDTMCLQVNILTNVFIWTDITLAWMAGLLVTN